VNFGKTSLHALAIGVLDLDYFGKINKERDELTGDAALRHMAAIVAEAVGDIVSAELDAGLLTSLEPARVLARGAVLGLFGNGQPILEARLAAVFDRLPQDAGRRPDSP